LQVEDHRFNDTRSRMSPKATGHDDAPAPRWTAVALPAEHGGWGLLLEPVALGLALAPSWAGLGAGAAAVCAFLARLPVRLAVQDAQRGVVHPRTRLARRVAAGYAAGALGFGVLGLWGAPGSAWAALAAALPLASIQLLYDLKNRGRDLVPEMLGATAASLATPVLALVGGAPLAVAFAAGALLLLRSLGAILYVRARLRRARGVPTDRRPALVGHAFAFGAATLAAAWGLGPWLAALAFALLAARALHGLASAAAVKPKVVGVQELLWGTTTTALLAVGYAAGW
jgi:hypothetical protein